MKGDQRIVVQGGLFPPGFEIKQAGEDMGDDALLLAESHDTRGFEIVRTHLARCEDLTDDGVTYKGREGLEVANACVAGFAELFDARPLPVHKTEDAIAERGMSF